MPEKPSPVTTVDRRETYHDRPREAHAAAGIGEVSGGREDQGDGTRYVPQSRITGASRKTMPMHPAASRSCSPRHGLTYQWGYRLWGTPLAYRVVFAPGGPLAAPCGPPRQVWSPARARRHSGRGRRRVPVAAPRSANARPRSLSSARPGGCSSARRVLSSLTAGGWRGTMTTPTAMTQRSSDEMNAFIDRSMILHLESRGAAGPGCPVGVLRHR